MKPSYRYYTAERGAKFRSGEQELILRKGDLFRLEKYEGRLSVIKDGVVYGVDARLVGELKKRSEAASLAKTADARHEFLNRKGLDIDRVMVKNLMSVANTYKGVNVTHAFKNNTVFFAFNTSYDQRAEQVSVVFQVNTNAVAVMVLCHDNSSVDGWAAMPGLRKSLDKLQSYLKTKYGVSFDKIKYSAATYGNVTIAGKPFTGRIYIYAANWYM